MLCIDRTQATQSPEAQGPPGHRCSFQAPTRTEWPVTVKCPGSGWPWGLPKGYCSPSETVTLLQTPHLTLTGSSVYLNILLPRGKLYKDSKPWDLGSGCWGHGESTGQGHSSFHRPCLSSENGPLAPPLPRRREEKDSMKMSVTGLKAQSRDYTVTT